MSFTDPTIYTFSFNNITGEARYIILEKKFILAKMNNITHRLLGLNTDDELTTSHPSKDNSGAFTIFEKLGISWESMYHLVYFLRMNRLNKEFHEDAMQAAITLGGFEDLDKYIYEVRKPVYNIPKNPHQDCKSEYDWMLISILNEELMHASKCSGYICTGVVPDGNYSLPYLYYRKPLK